MSERSTVRFHPEARQGDASTGSDLLSVAIDTGVPLEHLCGGNGLCGTCEIEVDAGGKHLSSPSEVEQQLLSSDAIEQGRRLACRCSLVDPGEISITVPAASLTEGDVVLTKGHSTAVELDPVVEQYHLRLDAPTLDDGVADRERLLEGLADAYDLEVDSIDHHLHRELPALLRAGAHDGTLEVTATVYDERTVIDLEPGNVRERYGLAIDVGTTTLAVYLIDLSTGEELAVTSGINPQSDFGEDLMSRMRYCRNQKDGREKLQEVLISGLNDLIERALTQVSVDRSRVYEAVFVGNTAMHHLFLGYDPTHVAGAPYVPARHASVTTKADRFGLCINEAGYLHWLPISGGWVGPDKVAVLLASGHLGSDKTTVCIDIGTNGEISVANPGCVLTTSAPAGPALEGAELTCGVRARPGAIDTVEVDSTTHAPTISTIENEPPIGICGSGVIDAVASCFVTGVIDRRGTFTDEAVESNHVVELDDGELAYELVSSADAATVEPIRLTQNDIRDVQMAKAAIQAGTRVLLAELDEPTVDQVVVAGGFGNHINVQSAIDIGLYPDVPKVDVTSLGNGAGAGARLALLDHATREKASQLVESIDYHEIAGTDAFEQHFLEAMYLPHQRFETCPRVKDRIEANRPTIEVEQARG